MALQRTITRVKMALEDLLVRKVFGDSKVAQVRQLNTVNLTSMQLATTALKKAGVKALTSGDWYVAYFIPSNDSYTLPYYWVPFAVGNDNGYSVLIPDDNGLGRWLLDNKWTVERNKNAGSVAPQASSPALDSGLASMKSSFANGGTLTLAVGLRGDMRRISNKSVNRLDVYPHIGGRINSLPVNAIYSVNAGESISFVALNSVQWATFKSVY